MEGERGWTNRPKDVGNNSCSHSTNSRVLLTANGVSTFPSFSERQLESIKIKLPGFKSRRRKKLTGFKGEQPASFHIHEGAALKLREPSRSRKEDGTSSSSDSEESTSSGNEEHRIEGGSGSISFNKKQHQPSCYRSNSPPMPSIPPPPPPPEVLDILANDGPPLPPHHQRSPSDFEDGGGSYKVASGCAAVFAIYSYRSDNDAHLQFKEGDQIEVTEYINNHWWLGRCNGQHGVFPSNRVVSASFLKNSVFSSILQ